MRQAYDEIARPLRLTTQLALLPAVAVLARFGGAWGVGSALTGVVALAEIGRRRAGGRRVFPATASLLAPAWLAERAICSWLAVAARLALGGVPYRGRVLRHAATPMRVLRARHARLHPAAAPPAGSRRRSA